MDNEPNYEAPVGGATPLTTDGGGSQGVTAGTPASAGQPNPTGAQPPAGARPVAPAAPAVPSGFVPIHRLNEALGRIKQMNGELTQLRRPAAPAAPAATPNAADEEVKQAFFKLFPGAKALLDLPADKLSHALERMGQHEASFEHYWTSFGSAALRALNGGIQKTYGGQPDAPTRRLIDAAFIDWLESDQEAQHRFFTGDPTLADDFWNNFTSKLLDPIRRTAVASEQQRITRREALPRPTPRGATLGQGGQPKPKTAEELHEAAAEAFITSR